LFNVKRPASMPGGPGKNGVGRGGFQKSGYQKNGPKVPRKSNFFFTYVEFEFISK
jgi:hypothetical protein